MTFGTTLVFIGTKKLVTEVYLLRFYSCNNRTEEMHQNSYATRMSGVAVLP